MPLKQLRVIPERDSDLPSVENPSSRYRRFRYFREIPLDGGFSKSRGMRTCLKIELVVPDGKTTAVGAKSSDSKTNPKHASSAHQLVR